MFAIDQSFLFFLMLLRPSTSTLFPYTTLFRSRNRFELRDRQCAPLIASARPRRREGGDNRGTVSVVDRNRVEILDRKSTRLNSSHSSISYAVFCLKKKITSNYRPLTRPRTK